MKILHIVSSYWPAFEFGGPIESVHQLNKELVKKGVEITVYTTNAGLRKNKEIQLKKEAKVDGVKVFYFPYYGYVHWTFSQSLFLEIGKNIKKFDLVHITGVWNFPVSAAAFWARFYKKLHIISLRGSLMREPLEIKSFLKKKIYLLLFAKRDFKKASAIHFTIEKEKDDYLKLGLPLKKAVIVPNSIDTRNCASAIFGDFRKKNEISENAKIILFMGRLHKIKGLDTLIPAFAEVIKKEPKAVLVLAGPDENNYKKEIIQTLINIDKTLIVADNISINQLNQHKSASFNIIFTGMLLGDDKIAVYRESDVFILPSYSENFGMAVVEAMYFGLPVVITKGVGISGEIEKASAGLVVEKDVKQVAEAILKILNNPDLAKKMGENGRKLVEAEFSGEKVAEKWIKEYNEIINYGYKTTSF